MTITQILAMVDDLYPNSVSPSTKIEFLNDALGELSREFGRFKESTSIVTVASQERYELPSDCIDISHVVALMVSTVAPPTSDNDYIMYSPAMQNDLTKSGYQFYDMGSDAAYAKRYFGIYPIPTTSGYTIRVRYRSQKSNYTLSDVSLTPDIDPRWHSTIAYYVISMCASAGTITEPVISNFWAEKFDADRQSYKMSQARMEREAPKRRRDNRQWHSRAW